MLYLVTCHLCNFLLISKDVTITKQTTASHLKKSHRLDYGCFVADLSLKDFADVTIMRIRDKATAHYLLEASKTKAFWNTYRNASRLAEALAQNSPFL